MGKCLLETNTVYRRSDILAPALRQTLFIAVGASVCLRQTLLFIAVGGSVCLRTPFTGALNGGWIGHVKECSHIQEHGVGGNEKLPPYK